MPRRVLLLVLLLSALSSLGAPNTTPQNLDFESGAPGEVPPGWFAPTAYLGYVTAIDTDSPRQGKQSVRVSGTPKPATPGGMAFGNVMQSIDATPYRGKRVRLRGAVKVAAGTAALWMRVDRPARVLGFLDSMSDRPILASDWTDYEIAGDVAADAETINIGMMVRGEGTAWLDDVTLETITPRAVRTGKPRAVSPRGMENLVAFTRLFGIVRHFHASDEAAAADWDAVAVNAVDAIEGAKDAGELAKRLQDVFLPVAPSLRVYATGTAAPKFVKPAGAEAIVSWEHHGFGSRQQPERYTSERVRRAVNDEAGRSPDPLQPLSIEIGGGVSASIPLAVFADASHTLPLATREAAPFSKAAYTVSDRSTRIADVVILWNVIQHFYPYFDVVDVDWPAELRTALRAAGEDRGEDAFLRTLRRMIAAIDDGHGSVSGSSTQARAPLPLRWRAIDKALIVTAVDNSVSGISIGDEVTAIDGRPPLPLLAEAEQLVSGATPQWRRLGALREIALGPVGSASTLTLRNADGSTRTVSVKRTTQELLRETRPDQIAELKPGIWYVDLDRVTDADFDASLGKLAAARGIVFDLRGYPHTGTGPLRHIIDGLTESAHWIIPVLRRPDRADAEWPDRPRWQLTPLQPRLTKNIAFLTDCRAISYAESWMGIIQAYKLAPIVGETTAGTNGNINTIQLPGDYRVVFTGMRVLKHDGSRHHGVGIAPTIPVSPTQAGIRAGRDEQLEKAVAILEK